MKKLLILILFIPCVLKAQLNVKIGVGNSTKNESGLPVLAVNGNYNWYTWKDKIELRSGMFLLGQYQHTVITGIDGGIETTGKAWVNASIGYGYIFNLQHQDRHIINDTTTLIITKGISTNGLFRPIYQIKAGYSWLYISGSYCYNELWYSVGMRLKI